MSRKGLLFLWVALALLAHLLPGWLPGPGAQADLPERSDRRLSYEIDATLDAEKHVVTATGTLTWRNDATVPVPDLELHLYLNAFRDRKSTFMRESGGNHRGHDFDDESPGSIELTRLARKGGADLLAQAAFVQPDDGNADDKTVMRVPLDAPIPPGEEITLELAWTSRLPKVFARTGFGGEFHLVAQWFPKLGVFQEGEGHEPGWCCHQFHGSSEFFADYGTYRVRLRVPDAYAGRVGASGRQDGPIERGEDGTLVYTFVAEDVHDFAWTCDTDFVVKEYRFEGGAGTAPEERDRVAALRGVDPERLALTPVDVRILLQPEHADQAERHRDAVFHALTYMGLWYGRYPYDTLTVVDPDHRARDAGGMEYPTLITAGTGYVVPEDGWTPQFVLVHEFGHQHFYGLVGTNEFQDAWMDEGLCTYATARTMMRAYPPTPSYAWYAGLPVEGERILPFDGFLPSAPAALPALGRWLKDDAAVPFGTLGFVQSIARALGATAPDTIRPWPQHGECSPLSFLREVPPLGLLRPLPATVRQAERTRGAQFDLVDPIVGTYAWQHMDRGSYANNSYRRTANAMRTLEGWIGDDEMVKALGAYTERYRFRHPRPDDLFGAISETTGRDLAWYFDAAFRGTDDLDFGVGELREDEGPGDDKARETVVVLRRFGGMRFPTEVRLVFDDGSERRLRWNLDDSLEALDGQGVPKTTAPRRPGQGRWRDLRFVGGPRLVVAEVDPRRLVDLDGDRTNDGLSAEARSVGLALALRLLAWVEMNTTFYGGL